MIVSCFFRDFWIRNLHIEGVDYSNFVCWRFIGGGVRVDEDAGGRQSGEMLIDFPRFDDVTLASASSKLASTPIRAFSSKRREIFITEPSPPGGTRRRNYFCKKIKTKKEMDRRRFE